MFLIFFYICWSEGASLSDRGQPTTPLVWNLLIDQTEEQDAVDQLLYENSWAIRARRDKQQYNETHIFHTPKGTVQVSLQMQSITRV